MAVLPAILKMNPVIKVTDLSKNYKNIPALHNVSLEVNRGMIFGLIGPDGAGKSTLIHLITGVLGATGGKVSVLGKDVLRYPESIKTSIGFLPQGLGLALAQELSVDENINFFAEINHVDIASREKRKDILLKSTQLDAFRDRPAKNLSGGMKQKLALCCTLIHEPELVFLDEPTTGVDPISRRDLWTIINTMVKEKNLTVFMTTSYMDEAARCHDIILLHDGKIVERGRPETLPSRLEGAFAEITTDDQQKTLKVLRDMPGMKVIYPKGDRLKAIYENTDIEGITAYARKAGTVLRHVEKGTAGIEDVFLSKISKKNDTIDESAFEEFFSKKHEPNSAQSAAGTDEAVMIKTDLLEKKFGDFTAVNKVSFDVKRGEIFGFLGPNGAGKTTTIKMLCGLYPPTSGKGSIGGLDLFKQQFEVKKSIGYMSQKFSLYRDLTVSENIKLYGGIYGVPRGELERRAGLILRIADLEGRGDAITGALPMGIKQRLALGCAIIHKPRCIFLDEPTSGVDPIARRKFWDIIFLLSRRMGVTVLVTTHYMDEAEHCDRLSLMTKGNLVAIGKPDALKDRVCAEIGDLLELRTDDPFLTVETLKKDFKHCLIYGADVHLYTKREQEATVKIKEILAAKGITLRNIKKSTMPFEDVFVYFCEHGSKDG
ncbi:MAG: ATP-binding cassette domain-containing protein [Candidatus Omnitrophota bacterium]